MDQETQSTGSLFDFIYADTQRIGSYLAQLVDEGVQTSAKIVANTNDGHAVKAQGSIPGIAKGSGTWTESAGRSLEKSFDATWSLPLNLLDLLDRDGYISRDISQCELGHIVLIEGTLSLLDIKLMQKLWAPATQLSASQTKTTHANKSVIQSQKSQTKLMGDVLANLPSAVQVYVNEKHGNLAWGTFKQEMFAGSSDDINMKYGGYVDGSWQILAVLDAKPSYASDRESFVIPNELFNVFANVIDQVREAVGRPYVAYGITPLMIFRKVGKAA